MESLFLKGSNVIRILKEHGFEAYFVGGAVRDYLLHRPVHDVDITTSASVNRVEQLFEDTVPLGKEHGTIIVHYQGCSFEVSTFRTSEGEQPSLIEDLQRRDFTINAMAMTENLELKDELSFCADLDQKLIRAVGNGVDRFSEDPLRMLRACRFSSQLNFEIEQNTLQSMIQCCSQIEKIAIERLVSEFEKLIKARFFTRGLHYLFQVELPQHIPMFKTKQHTLQQLTRIQLDIFQSIEEIWTAFVYLDQNENPNKYIKLLRKSRQFNQQVVLLHQALKKYEIKGWSNELMYELGLENSLKLVRLIKALLHKDQFFTEQEVCNWYAELPIKNRQDLDIDGQILLKIFQTKQGPWIEKLFKKVEKAVLAQELENDCHKIVAWLRKERDYNDEGEALGDALRR